MPPEPPEPRTPRHLLERLKIIPISSKRRQPPGKWLDGKVPDRGPAFLCVDGFYSQSFPAEQPPFTPLVYALRPTVLAFDPSLQMRGYSFRAPEEHFNAYDTDIQLLHGGATEKFSDYVPRVGIPIRYGAFSLGCPLLLMALGDWVRTCSESSPERLALLQDVILIQPAFTLRAEVKALTTTAPMGVTVPRPLLEMSKSAPEFERLVIEALEALRTAGVPVSMLYWSGDGILDYTGWKERFEARGATVVHLDDLSLATVASDRLVEAFIEHSRIVVQDQTNRCVLDLLHRTLGE